MLCISSTAIGSIPAKGSSSKIIFGSAMRVLAISTFLLCPPESCLPFKFKIFLRLKSSIDFSTYSFI